MNSLDYSATSRTKFFNSRINIFLFNFLANFGDLIFDFATFSKVVRSHSVFYCREYSTFIFTLKDRIFTSNIIYIKFGAMYQYFCRGCRLCTTNR